MGGKLWENDFTGRNTGWRWYSSRLVKSAVVQAVTDVKDAEQNSFSILVQCAPVLLGLSERGLLLREVSVVMDNWKLYCCIASVIIVLT